MKTLGLVPLAGAIPVTNLLDGDRSEAQQSGLAHAPDLFKELGVEPIINARGTMTFLSGNLMMPEVIQAIRSTSTDFVNMYELQDKVGARIAKMLNCGGAVVTSGAACALTIGTAGVLTGTDPEKIRQLPFLPGPPREVVIQKSHRYVFDQNIRMAGVEFVEVEGPREMKRAINKNTVMAFFFNAASDWYGVPDSISRENFVDIAKRRNIPTFIDAAADVPPVDRLFEYQRVGFDLVTFSGGKIIRGPQSAGLLFGRKDLIEAAKLNFSPNEAPIGRSMKVNKEEIFGMYAALKSYLERDHDKEWREWTSRAKRIARQLESVPTVHAEIVVPKGPSNQFPGLVVTWDTSKVKLTPEEAAKTLSEGKPRIEVGGGKESLSLAVVTLRDDQVNTVARRVREVLKSAV